MKHASLLFGAGSDISQWITEELIKYNIEPIKIFSQKKSISNNSLKADITSYDDVINIMSQVKRKNVQIKLVFICSGAVDHSFLSDSNVASWQNTINVNLLGPYHIYRALIESKLYLNSNIKFITIGSTALISRPKGLSSYAASKHALEDLVTYINNEKPEEIRSCCIRLGTCNTKFAKTTLLANKIDSSDLQPVIKLLIEAQHQSLPELIVLRPINF